jgi:TP901 family phage tail tape measure protein
MGADVSFAITARDQASRTLQRVGHNVDETGDSVDRLGRGFAKFGTVAAVAIGAAAAAGAAFLLKVGAPYVDSLNKIQTLTGSTDAVMKKTASTLEDNAGLYAKMGQTTGDAAAGVVELTKAGMSLGNAMKAVNATMVLAKAGEMDVADASALVSNTLNTFGMSAQHAGDIANYLANAANISSADVSDLAESMKYVAPVAASTGISLKQTSAILAELSNSGIAASNAGTGFRKFLLSLQAPSGAAATDLKELGVQIFDSAGKMKALPAVVNTLGRAMSGLADEKRQKILKDIFGLQGVSSAQVILKNGTEGLDKYTKAVGRAGAAQALANSASKGLMGTLQMLKARAVSWGQAMYRQWSPIADDLIRNRLIPALQSLAQWMGKNRAVIEPVAAVLAGLVVGVIAVTYAVKGFAGAMVVLDAVMDANPIALVIVALAGLAAGLVYAYHHSASFRNVMNDIGQVIKTKVFPIISSFVGFVRGKLLPIIEQTAAKVGHNLKPVWDALVSTFKTQVLPTVQKVLVKFHEWQPTIQKVILFVAKMIGKWLEFQSAILGKVLPVMIKFSGWLTSNGVQAQLRFIGAIAKAIGKLFEFGSAVYHAGVKVVQFAAAVGRAVGKAIGFVLTLPTRIQGAVSGFGTLLFNAGRSLISGLISGIMSKFGDLGGTLGYVTSYIAAHKGPPQRDRVLLTPAGVAIMEGLISGIESRKSALGTVLAKMTDYIKSKVDKLHDLMSQRSDFASQFQSFTSSVFTASFTDPKTGEAANPTIGSMMAYEQRERSKAMRLRRDATKLIKMGLSKDLIRQLAASGESGLAQIHALAQGTRAQVQRFNTLNQGINTALQNVGDVAGNALYGDQIKQTQRDIDVARKIEDALERLLKKEREGTKFMVFLDGHQIRTSLVKIKRESGKNLGLA